MIKLQDRTVVQLVAVQILKLKIPGSSPTADEFVLIQTTFFFKRASIL